ncbi:MAG: methyltransferase type 12, partial [Gammaproteobacteria bacterium]
MSQETAELATRVRVPAAGGPRVLSVADALGLGLEHHQRGHLRQAAGIYAAILEQVPEQFDALHFSGVLALQQGRSTEAADLIGRAVARRPG